MQKPTRAGLVNKLGRPLGVEIELTNTDKIVRNFNPDKIGTWDHDGTIHPPGHELVMNPASGDRFISQIAKVVEKVNVYEPIVNESCGLHVHVQAGDLSAWDLRRLIYLWWKIEPEVYRFMIAPHRLNNNACLRYSIPLNTEVAGNRAEWQFTAANIASLMRSRYRTATQIKNAVIKKLYNIDLAEPKPGRSAKEAFATKVALYKQAARNFKRWKEDKRTPGQAAGGGCRYAALNIHSYFHRGTVEFRLKEGTLDEKELIFWPLFCGWIVESVGKLRDEQVRMLSGLADWCRMMEGIVQPAVIAYVKEKMKK